jgi:hypothetical protein
MSPIILDDFQMHIGVALAGFLLEYPISYVPTEGNFRSLDGKPLRVFLCSLLVDPSKRGVSKQ